jgi:hypothetical protein
MNREGRLEPDDTRWMNHPPVSAVCSSARGWHGFAAMRRFLFPLFVVTVLALGEAPARADGFITPYAGFNFGGDAASYCAHLTNCDDRRLNWGVAFGGTGGIFGFEEDIAYSPDFFGKVPGQSSSVLTVMSNLMLIVPAGPVQPYALVGIGLIRPHFSASNLTTDKNAVGYDVGGGLNLYFARHVGVRGDIRHIHTFEDVALSVFSGDRLNFWRASGGVTFRF